MKRLAFAALFAVCACDSDSPPPPPPDNLAASYALSTELDVPVEAVLPPPAYDLALTLKGLREKPGETVFTLLKQQGGGALEILLDALPSAAEDRIEGYIGQAIQKHLDLTELDPIIELIETSLADIQLASTLETSPAVHRLERIAFVALGEGVELPIDLSLAPQARQEVTLSSAGEDLVVMDHAFTLPLGVYAWTAIDQVIVAEYGTDLRSIVTSAVDCAVVGAEVANREVFNVEIGHADEIQAVCEEGLEEIADQVEAQVKGIVWEALRFSHGQSGVVDSNSDGVAEALVAGTWNATIDAGQGPRNVPGGFIGAAK